MKWVLLAGVALLALTPSVASAACSATYPVGDPNDSVISFLAGGTNKPFMGPSTFQAVEAGTLTYDSTANVLKLCDGTDWQTVASSAGGASQWVNGASGSIYYNAGNVGIGTATVNYPLHVAQSNNGSITRVIVENSYANTASSTDEGAGLYFGFGGQLLGAAMVATKESDYSSAANRDSALNFYTQIDGALGSPKMTISSAGNVGIGTSSPYSKVEIIGDALSIGSNTGAAALGIELRGAPLGAIPAAQTRGYIATGDSTIGTAGDLLVAPRTNVASSIRFVTGTTPTERMRIDSSGNVGIGTSSPYSKVEIIGDALSIGSNTGAAALGIELRGAPLGAIPAAQTRGYIATGDSTIGTAGDLLVAPRTNAATSIRFVTGTTPTERMRIDSSGNVGIGTAAPGYNLHVYKNDASSATAALEQDATGDVALYYILTGEQGWYTGIDNSDTNKFKIASSTLGNGYDHLTIDTLGKVGIGTTSPLGKLHTLHSGTPVTSHDNNNEVIFEGPNRTFGAGARGNVFIVSNDTAAADKGGSIAFGGKFSGDMAAMLGGIRTGLVGSFGGYMAFATRPDGGNPTERLRIDSSGNVGIGTTTPTAQLDVSGGGLSLVLGADSNATTRTDSTQKNARIGVAHYLNAEEPMAIIYGSSTNGANTLNIGGGTTMMNAASVINFFTAADTVTTTGTTQMTITSTGRVGIGTTNPNQGKVEVKGGTVCVDTDSDDNATSCIASESDARLKTNVVDLKLSLDSFMKLRPVSYDWKVNDPEILKNYPLISRFADRPHTIGLIAQEVAEIVPEAIESEMVGEGETKYFQLDYTKLIPVIIKAVQDLVAMVTDMKDTVMAALDGHDRRIKQLEAENAVLKARLDALEAKFAQ